MLPSLVTEIPKGEDWVYEVKYDGFRALIYLENEEVKIISRNQNVLNQQFPEITEGFTKWRKTLDVPMILDGELCVLESEVKANFDQIQKRGRLKTQEKIEQAKKATPVTFIAFDLIMEADQFLGKWPLLARKETLAQVIEKMGDQSIVKLISFYEDYSHVWDIVTKTQGEGIVCKRKDSIWQEGQRSKQWLKIKNMMIASFFIIAYDEANTFFHIGCLFKGEIKLIGKVGQGFTKEEKEALVAIVKKNRVKTVQNLIYVKPSICIEVEFLEISKNELRHPKFRRFRLDKDWEDCTWEAIPQLEPN